MSQPTQVRGADGCWRVIQRSLDRSKPHLTREDRLWVARAPGRQFGIGYTPSHALKELECNVAAHAQDARGPLMAPVGTYQRA